MRCHEIAFHVLKYTLWLMKIYQSSVQSYLSSEHSLQAGINGYTFSKLDLCEGGSFSPTIFKSDIEINAFHILSFISVCRFVEGNICQKIAHCFV